MSGELAWVNGRFVAADAAIAAGDAGYQLGVGVFETMGARQGRLPLWERHLRRLAEGAQRLRIPCAAPAELRAAAHELLARTQHRDGVLRLTVSGGVPGAAEKPEPGATWCMIARPRRRPGPVRLIEVPFATRSDDVTAGIKCTSRAAYHVALQRAKEAGADDALLIDASGAVLETTTANVVALVGGALVTPPLSLGILPGIARALLLEAGVAREGAVTLDDLRAAEGVWVTNAVEGPRPALLAGGPGAVESAVLAQVWARALSAGA